MAVHTDSTAPRPGLLELPEPILLEIVSYFKPRASTTHRSHFPINYTSPSDELIALSAVSRLARSLLAPHVHAVLSIGTKPTTGRKKSPLLKLKNGHSLLSCVRHLIIHDVKPGLLIKLLKHMPNMRFVTYASYKNPLPAALVQAGTEGRPALEGLALASLSYQVTLESLHELSKPGSTTLKHLSVKVPSDHPDDVAQARSRWGLSGCLDTAPREQDGDSHFALSNALSQAILKSRHSLETFEMTCAPGMVGSLSFDNIFQQTWSLLLVSAKDGNGCEMATLPSLERFALHRIGCASDAVSHVINTSPRLQELCVSDRLPMAIELEPPIAKDALRVLKIFRYCCVMDLSIAHSVHDIAARANLHSLELQGFHAKETLAIFSSASAADFTLRFGSLRSLDIAVAGGNLVAADLLVIVRACPIIRHLTITALTWKADWLELVKALSHLYCLTDLVLDHPISPRRLYPGYRPPWPTGETIRSDAAGHFTQLTAEPGQTIADGILEQINQDLNAATPYFSTRFTRLGRKLHHLQTLIWRPTPEVTWNWFFLRCGTELRVKDEREITFQPAPWQMKKQRKGWSMIG